MDHSSQHHYSIAISPQVGRSEYMTNRSSYKGYLKWLLPVRCLTLVTLAYMALLLAMGIIAVLVHDGVIHPIKDSFGDGSCLRTYDGISFDYKLWLYVYGWTKIGLIAIMILSALASLAKELKDRMENLANSIVGMGVLFHLAWYIVGAVLFFKTVYPSCSGPFYSYTLTSFIVQCVIWGINIFAVHNHTQSN